jgi:hypothetical protein
VFCCPDRDDPSYSWEDPSFVLVSLESDEAAEMLSINLSVDFEELVVCSCTLLLALHIC